MSDAIASASPSAGATDAYAMAIRTFRAQREAELVAEDGWLTVVGLDWLEDGDNRVGSAPGCEIQLPGGPSSIGVVTVSADGITIALDPAAGATVDGQTVAQATLVDTAADPHRPTVVRCGAVNFHVVDRDGRKGLRIKDNNAPARRQFTALEYFDIDLAWRIFADWVPLDPPREMHIATSWGNIMTKVARHKAVFQQAGKTHELFPVPNQDTDLMFVLADRTSGKETYGACRFLTGELLGDDKIVLDFNKAINPPCAFTAFATCPIAPPENRLTIRIPAGERVFNARH